MTWPNGSDSSAATIDLEASGAVKISNGGSQPVAVTLDLNGYFRNGATSVSMFIPTEVRLYGSAKSSAVAAGATRSIQVAGATSDFSADPSAFVAVLANVTVTSSAQSGSLTVYASGTSRPSTATLAYNAFEPAASALTLSAVGSDGTISVYNSGPAPVTIAVDAEGWFAEASYANQTANQEALMAYHTWLITQPDIYESGYVAAVDDLATKSITLLWAGDSSMQRLAVAEAADMGITASIQSVSWDKSQLDIGAQTLLDHASDSGWGDFIIDSIAETNSMHDGLTIQGHYTGEETPSIEDLTAFADSILTASGLSTMDVQIAVLDPIYLLVDTRANDAPPFNAGGIMYEFSGGLQHVCSSGFGVYGSQGVAHTMTARHCTNNPYYSLQGDHSYGTVSATSNVGAAIMLSSRGSHRVFDGESTNTDGYSKGVLGYADVAENDYVCTSGGNSGVHCNIKVNNLSVWYDDGFGEFETISAKQQSTGNFAAAEGDSGGPVMVPYTGDTTVGAVGMIQAGRDIDSIYCGGLVFGDSRCFDTVLFTSMRTITSDLGVTLRTINN